MPVLLAIILGFIQAATEFLPVSSSGHLVIAIHYFQSFFGSYETPLAFEVWVHLATLLATLLYLKAEIITLLKALLSGMRSDSSERRLIFAIIIGSIPAAVLGVGCKIAFEEVLQSVPVAAIGFFVTTAALLKAHRAQHNREKDNSSSLESSDGVPWKVPTIKEALIIGTAQAIAIFPGVSRSGMTIATALTLKLPVETALKFSFLLSIPAISGATLLEARNIAGLDSADYAGYAFGFLTAFAVGILALKLLVHVTKGRKLVYFAGYTLSLGVILSALTLLS